MLDQFRGDVGLSFKELEETLWHYMLKEFAQALTEIVQVIDDYLLQWRCKKRFVSKDRVTRSLMTMFGAGVSITRRRYLDTETGEDAYLLD